MADKKKDAAKSTATPGIDPKAVHVGGESLVDRIVPHIKKIAVMVVVVAVVVSGILVFRWRGEAKKQASTEKLLDTMEVERREVGPEPAPSPIPGKTPKAPEPRFATDKDRADAVLASLNANGANAPTSFRGSLLMDAGKYDEAIAEYKSGVSIDGLEGLLNREGLGLALEAKATAEKDATARQKGLEDALAAFVAMQPDENGPRRAYALYHQARIQQLLGKTAEAKALFEKAKPLAQAEEPDTKDPETNAKLLPAMIDRRLASL